jgi:hypothetical protein
MEPVTVALVAGAQVILLALITGWVTSRKEKRDAERLIAAALAAAKIKTDDKIEEARLKREEKLEDWRRQDEVAARAEVVAERAAAAADLLVKAQAETIKRTEEVARLAMEADQRNADKLDAIHILVNSDMTAARTAERDSLKLLVIALKNSFNLSVKLGMQPTEAEQDEIVRVEKRIVELNQILADRLAAQLKVDTENDAKKAPTK